MTVVLDWATHESAKYACENWHYSRSMPVGKLVKIGVWEDRKYVGVVIFSRGASPHLLSAYGLTQSEGCELTRIALWEHVTPVSRILSISMRFLRINNPAVRLVISFADPERGHVGAVYQAANWTYTGISAKVTENYIDGRWQHVRASYHKAKHGNYPVRSRHGKYRYCYAFDADLKQTLHALPYPKRQKDSSEPLGVPAERGRGSTDPDAPTSSEGRVIPADK
jgi:hypothetical protein